MAISSYLRSSPLAQASAYASGSSLRKPGTDGSVPSSLTWKELANQNLSDPDLLAMFGPGYIQERDGKKFYTGKVDPSSFQFGTAGLQTEDIGQGKFNIRGPQGQNLGVGYKPVAQALDEILTQNLMSDITAQGSKYVHPALSTPTTQYVDLGAEGGGVTEQSVVARPDEFSDRATLESELEKYAQGFRGKLGQGSQLEQYKLLGDVLTGKSDYSNLGLKGFGFTPSGRREFLGQKGTNTLSGEQTLYGSDPLLRLPSAASSSYLKATTDPAVLGYRINMSPAEGGIGAIGGLAQQKKDMSGRQRSVASLYRDLGDAEKWKAIGSGLPSGDFLVSPENVDKIPGWSDKYDYGYSKKASGLEKTLNVVVPMVLGSVFGPLASAGWSAIQGDDKGALMSLAGWGLNASGYNPAPAVSGSLQSAGLPAGLANAAAQGLVSGTMSGIGSAASGGNFGRGFLQGAAGGAAGSYTGNYLNNALSGSGFSPAVTRGLSTAGSRLAGSLASGLASGNKLSPKALAINAALSGARGYYK